MRYRSSDRSSHHWKWMSSPDYWSPLRLMRFHGTRKSCAKNGIKVSKPALKGQGTPKNRSTHSFCLAFTPNSRALIPAATEPEQAKARPAPKKAATIPAYAGPWPATASLLRPLIPAVPRCSSNFGTNLNVCKTPLDAPSARPLTGKTPDPAKPASLTPPLRQIGLRSLRQSTGQKAAIER